MSESLKPKDDKYIDSTGIVHRKNPLSNILDNLPSKIQQNNNAWPGKTNKITVPIVYYGFYLVISSTPSGNCSMYIITIIGSSITKYKISGNRDTDFAINGKELSITLSENNYWVSFVQYLGNLN